LITVGSASAAEGERALGGLAVGLEDGTTVEIPVGIVHGARSGPVLYLQAAQHGNELNGIAAITRVWEELKPSALSGALVAVPVANPPALRAGSYSGDMSRTLRLSHALFHEAVVKADYALNFHAWSQWKASSVIVADWDRASLQLAEALGLTFISPVRRSDPVVERKRMLLPMAVEAGIPFVTPELSGVWDVYPRSVEEGYRGILNVMRHLGMVEGRPVPPKRRITVGRDPSREVRSPAEGLYMPMKEPGAEVKAGESLGRLIKTRTPESIDVESPTDGVIWRNGKIRRNLVLPSVDRDEVVAVIYE